MQVQETERGRERRQDVGKIEPKYVDWVDVLGIGVNVVYGEALVGKTRQALALAKKFMDENKKVMYIATEVNLIPLMDSIKKLLDGAEVIYEENPYGVFDTVKNLYRNRFKVKYDFVVLDSIGGIRENYRAMFGTGRLSDIAQVNQLVTRILHASALYAMHNKTVVFAITHMSRAIGKAWHGRDAMPTTTLHASHDATAIIHMYIRENYDEEGNIIGVERVAEVVEHRIKPTVVGMRIKLLEPPL